MERLEIIIPDGQKLSIRNFVEWEYNSGKADFQPDEHYPLWGTVPIHAVDMNSRKAVAHSCELGKMKTVR